MPAPFSAVFALKVQFDIVKVVLLPLNMAPPFFELEFPLTKLRFVIVTFFPVILNILD